MQPFVREGASETKPDSSENSANLVGRGVKAKDEHPENNNNNDSLNNNYGSEESWGSYQPPVQETVPAPEHFNPITGLENLGNTCYANSVFQVLRFTPGFTLGLKHVVEKMDFVESKLQV